jgi:hypothetical protein
MTLQDLALFALVCLSPAIVSVGMVACGLALTRGVLPWPRA